MTRWKVYAWYSGLNRRGYPAAAHKSNLRFALPGRPEAIRRLVELGLKAKR
jgi:hypothetical protein